MHELRYLKARHYTRINSPRCQAVLLILCTMVDESDKPQPPAQGECCESSCDLCVWDLYYEKLEEWQRAQKNNEITT